MKFYSGIVTGSLTVNGTQTINGTLTAQTLVVQTITSSISRITGSTSFGSSSINNHNFTGSLIVSGAMFVSSSGNTSFAGNVELNGPSGNRILTIQNNTSGDAILNLVAAGSDSGTITYKRSASELIFGNSSATSSLKIGPNGAATFANLFTTSDTSVLFLSPFLSTNNSVFLQLGRNISNTYNSGEVSFRYAGDGSTSNMISLGFYGSGQKLNVLGNGFVGINNTSPGSRLYVQTTAGATKAYDDLTKTNITCFDDTSMAAGVGGSITFGGYKTAQTNGGNFAAIDGVKENGTAGNEAGNFRIWTANSSGVFGERMRVTSTGNVGIGTNSPLALLDVSDGTSGTLMIVKNTSTANSTSKTAMYGFYGADTVGSLKAVGGMQAVPDNVNWISGLLYWYVRSGDAQVLRMSLSSGGALVISGALTQNGSPSDINLKENLVKITSPLEKISQINGYSFEWKEGTPARGNISNIVKDAGLIAQEVENIMPEIVRTSDEHKVVNYNGVIGLLVEAIKELNTKLDTANTKIAELEAK